jgi:hypothetical protein
MNPHATEAPPKRRGFFFEQRMRNVEHRTLKCRYSDLESSKDHVECFAFENGSVGSTVFGGVEKGHIRFNHEMLWPGKPCLSRRVEYVWSMALSEHLSGRK